MSTVHGLTDNLLFLSVRLEKRKINNFLMNHTLMAREKDGGFLFKQTNTSACLGKIILTEYWAQTNRAVLGTHSTGYRRKGSAMASLCNQCSGMYR